VAVWLRVRAVDNLPLLLVAWVVPLPDRRVVEVRIQFRIRKTVRELIDRNGSAKVILYLLVRRASTGVGEIHRIKNLARGLHRLRTSIRTGSLRRRSSYRSAAAGDDPARQNLLDV